MIELKDNMDFNDFLYELKPKSWRKRKINESISDWLDRTSLKSIRNEDRLYNKFWKKESIKFCLSILTFLRENNISKEQMEEDLNIELDLSGSYDWKLSEMCKIKNYIGL